MERTSAPPPQPESAGVRLDPQLLYAVPLAGGLLLDWWHPLRSAWPQFRTPVGIAVIALGVGLAAAAVRRFRSAGTSLQPWEPSTTLMTDGPFRFSRNPVYVAYTLVYLGVGSWMNSLWPLLLLPLVLWLMHRLVISREESYLEARFGEAYRDYSHRVRRWL